MKHQYRPEHFDPTMDTHYRTSSSAVDTTMPISRKTEVDSRTLY